MSQKYADIIIDISHSAIDRVFQYRISEALAEQVHVGSLVTVPFGKGNTRRHGYVIAITDTTSYEEDRIKEILDVPDKAVPIEGKLIQLAAWLKETYGVTMNRALQTVMPVKQTVRKTAQKVEETRLSEDQWAFVTLNDGQQALVEEFRENYQSKNRRPYLLHGVTGSGKTEVYIQCIKEVIRDGGQAIVLIPEISLTYQTVARFRKHFGDRVAFVNSKQSKGEKYEQFRKAKEKEVDVVIGPRSALFTPCVNLKLIVIDEEHDGAFKSDQAPRYHARDVAIKRAELEQAEIILGSATPSVESYTKAQNGEYRLWELPERPEHMQTNTIEVVDLREELRSGNRGIISRSLYNKIADRLEKKEQMMLFINRRGFNSFVSCRACGEPIKCPKCDVALTYHMQTYQAQKQLMCHYCGYSMEMPKACPACKSPMIAGFGTGTEKVEEEIHKLFPAIKTLRMDKDTTARKDAGARILKQFADGKADMLIGTQMIVKGHDYGNVTLVGVMLADLSLYANDFRAGERTFDLLTQAAGRAGRGDKPGEVVIQTYQPEHYAIAAAARKDYREFYDMEMTYRRMLHYPPVYDMLQVLLTGPQKTKVEEYADRLAKGLKDRTATLGFTRTRIVGPSEAAISRINEEYRYVIYVKAPGLGAVCTLRDYIETCSCEGIAVAADINPMTIC